MHVTWLRKIYSCHRCENDQKWFVSVFGPDPKGLKRLCERDKSQRIDGSMQIDTEQPDESHYPCAVMV